MKNEGKPNKYESNKSQEPWPQFTVGDRVVLNDSMKEIFQEDFDVSKAYTILEIIPPNLNQETGEVEPPLARLDTGEFLDTDVVVSEDGQEYKIPEEVLDNSEDNPGTSVSVTNLKRYLSS